MGNVELEMAEEEGVTAVRFRTKMSHLKTPFFKMYGVYIFYYYTSKSMVSMV